MMASLLLLNFKMLSKSFKTLKYWLINKNKPITQCIKEQVVIQPKKNLLPEAHLLLTKKKIKNLKVIKISTLEEKSSLMITNQHTKAKLLKKTHCKVSLNFKKVKQAHK